MRFNDQNFDDEVLSSSQPVLVDFYADWCGPCQVQAPIVEALKSDFKGKVKIGMLDVDSNQIIASNYQVMSIPTIIIFKDGSPVERLVGLQQKNILTEKLNNLV